MKKYLILSLLFLPINLLAQSNFCSILEQITHYVGHEEWSLANDFIEKHKENLKDEIFFNAILNKQADCLVRLGDVDNAILISKNILESKRFYNPDVDYIIHSECHDFWGENDQGQHYSWFIGEPEKTVKYRALMRLAEIEFAAERYEKSLNYMALTDSVYNFIPRINCHGCAKWYARKKALFRSEVYEKIGEFEKSIDETFTLVLSEYKPEDTLMTRRMIDLYNRYFSEKQLKEEFSELENSLFVKWEMLPPDGDVINYSIDTFRIYKHIETRESVRIVYFKRKNKMHKVYTYFDVYEYEKHLNLKRAERKKWSPKTNEELLEIARNELNELNIFKYIKTNQFNKK